MKVNKIIETINDKRKKYIKMYCMFPKRIEISDKYLVALYIHLLYIQVMPYWEIKKLYGMKIVKNNDIKRLKDIKVY